MDRKSFKLQHFLPLTPLRSHVSHAHAQTHSNSSRASQKNPNVLISGDKQRQAKHWTALTHTYTVVSYQRVDKGATRAPLMGSQASLLLHFLVYTSRLLKFCGARCHPLDIICLLPNKHQRMQRELGRSCLELFAREWEKKKTFLDMSWDKIYDCHLSCNNIFQVQHHKSKKKTIKWQ